MKKIVLILLALFSLKKGETQFKPVNDKSSIRFKIKTFGINVTGTLSGMEGEIFFDPNHLNDSKFDVSLDAATVNTDNSLRDSHLREDPFFEIKKYPCIHFVSTKIIPSAKNGRLVVSGKLSIKSQTRDISFPFTAEALQNNYLFKGQFTINRKDFDIGETNIISDEVTIFLNVFATKELNL